MMRRRRIEQLYHEARERDPRERAAFLDEACVAQRFRVPRKAHST